MNTPKPSAPPKVRLAILGLGRAGWGLHLQPALAHGGFEITDVVDPQPGRAEEARQLCGAEVHSSVDELLGKTSADAVVVATPSHLHFQDAKAVLASGRHCILEKPIAANFTEASDLADLAAKKQLRLFIHHSKLHSSTFHHLHDIVQSGKIGRVFAIQASHTSFSRRYDWQTLRKFLGGHLRNHCSHILSMALPLLDGPVEEVFADLRNIKNPGDAEDHVHLMLRTASGMTAALLVSTAVVYSGPAWVLSGTCGGYQCNEQQGTLRYFDPSDAPPPSVSEDPTPDRSYTGQLIPWKEESVNCDDKPCPSFYENIHQVLTAGGEPIVTIKSALEVMRVMDLALRHSGLES